MSPRSSAWVIIDSAIRSLTELAGLEDSSLATISAPHPATTLLSLTSGVLPMSSRTLFAIFSLRTEVDGRILRDVIDDGEKAEVVQIIAAADRKLYFIMMLRGFDLKIEQKEG